MTGSSRVIHPAQAAFLPALLWSLSLFSLLALSSLPVVRSFSTTPTDANKDGRRIRSGGVALAMDPVSAASNLLSSDSNNLDRFRSVCLEGTESKGPIDEFDSELHSSQDTIDPSGDLWAAVYRSNNNKPSVVVRDDFFRAMNDATSGKNGDSSGADASDSSNNNKDDDSASNGVSTVSGTASFLSDTMPGMLEIPSTKPVAIARLTKSETSTDTKTVYLLDNLRCSLKKETQDASCDGGSEFVEALSVAVDTLLLKHLQRLLENRDDDDDGGEAEDVVFEGTVRTKATLFSGRLFDSRGFAEIETLSRDMATHVSSYEACFAKYADRTIEATIASGNRDRALQIVALLGRLDPEVQKSEGSGGDGDDDDYDPWANMQLYRS
eukprot:CAMPEP_0197177818 /NCGR_PEP_ID=MMETSP1423-20130617/3285_1 /TAXON_ID=476441 /ORGANISM="Pseudo-nitzschia heimii, Strain UNC1101" /LENGTH=381 /DNA_ID=CAMNT_0042627425 /DNA_START=51 /DNA_END=1196 /DNA_ORIENTATION=-